MTDSIVDKSYIYMTKRHTNVHTYANSRLSSMKQNQGVNSMLNRRGSGFCFITFSIFKSKFCYK